MRAGMWKAADSESPSDLSLPSAAPLPQVAVRPSFPAGKKGPVGTSPRTNYSRVNTGAPLAPDGGASAQKSIGPLSAGMLPEKVAFFNEGSMATMTARPRLQDMVKAAMVSSIKRADIVKEASRQAVNLGEEGPAEEKTASRIDGGEKKASAEHARKLAAAVEYIVEAIGKEAAEGSNIASPPGVSESPGGETLPPHRGQAHHQPPFHPGLRKGLHQEKSPTQLDNDLDHAPGGSEHMMQTNYGKSASVVARIRKTAGHSPAKIKVSATAPKRALKKQSSILGAIRTKLAEDAINHAKISAGSAVPPEASASGESGGQPVGGAPQGPTSLISSNEAATNYKRRDAYANRKTDLKKYVNEPALSSQTDQTLAQAFNHTSEAGTKFSSAGEGVSTKTAAAKALIQKLADDAGAEVDRRSA